MSEIQLPCGVKLQSSQDPAAGLSSHLAIEVVCSHCRTVETCPAFHTWIQDNHRELSVFSINPVPMTSRGRVWGPSGIGPHYASRNKNKIHSHRNAPLA